MGLLRETLFLTFHVHIGIQKGFLLNAVVSRTSEPTNHTLFIIQGILFIGKVSKNLWFACFLTIIYESCDYLAKLLIFALLDASACYITLVL